MSSKVDFSKKQKLQDEYYDYYNMENIKIPEFLNEVDENDIEEMKKNEDSKKNEKYFKIGRKLQKKRRSKSQNHKKNSILIII